MPLNWAISVWLLLAAASIWMASFVVGFFRYRTNKYRHLLLILLSLLLNGCTNLLRAIAILFESETLGLISFYFLIPATVIIVVFLESIIRDTIRPITIAILSFISAFIIRATLEPGAIYFSLLTDGTKTLLENLELAAPVVLLLFCVVLLGIHLIFGMLKKTPKTLKKYLVIFLLGAILNAPFAALFYLMGNLDFVNIGANWLLSALGVSVIIFAFIKEPKLAFILPFNIYKIVILNTNTGILMFSHTFDKREQRVDDVLFSGMVQGINIILNEAMNKGALVELKLAKALIIIERDPKLPVACLLITTRSSSLLRKSLQAFFRRFKSEFSESISNLVDIEKFSSVETLIPQFFGFVPEYD